MAINTFKCNCLTSLHFKGLTVDVRNVEKWEGQRVACTVTVAPAWPTSNPTQRIVQPSKYFQFRLLVSSKCLRIVGCIPFFLYSLKTTVTAVLSLICRYVFV